MVFTTRELEILQTTSRVGSVFSVLGASFIIITFCTCKDFHRPINRLAFYASFGNIITNIATILSRDGIRQGVNSSTCQFQGFLIQWMIPSDALFCLAMAWNVYLTVFKKRTTTQLRRLEPYYIILCYGIPFIIAITFLVYKPPDQRPRIYGEATLWCWISPEWQVLRIAAFYGPVWVVLIVTFIIYLLAGRVIFILRRNLRNFVSEGSTAQSRTENPVFSGAPSALKVPDKTASSSPQAELELERILAGNPRGGPNHPPQEVVFGTTYTVEVESGATKVPRNDRNTELTRKQRNIAVEANTAAWAYCRCAMLFFLALVITWLPSSINRVYTLRNPDRADFGFNFAAALVLPCQGFWNGVIYIVTTLPVCKEYFRNIWRWMREKVELRRMKSSRESSQVFA